MLLLCGLDVDSLCACKILQCLLKVDSVPHTTIPVAGKEDLKRAYDEHAGQVGVMEGAGHLYIITSPLYNWICGCG